MKTVLSRSVKILTFLLIITAIALIATTLFYCAHAAPPPPPPASPSPDISADSVKDKLDAYSRRTDDLQKLISLLLTLTTIYGIALALSARAQVNDAKAELEKVVKQAKEGKDEALDLLPMFKHVDAQVRSIMVEVMQKLPTADVYLYNYTRLSHGVKQSLIFHEKTISSMEYFNLESSKEIISEIFHGFGNFYALKSEAERTNLDIATKNKSDAVVIAQLGEIVNADRARAFLYFAKSLDKNSRNTAMLNDRGFFQIAQAPQKAKEDFAWSLKINPKQQRPLYNLAVVAHDQAKRDLQEGKPAVAIAGFETSVQHLNEACRIEAWQDRPEPVFKAEMLYERVCSRARLATCASKAQEKPDLIKSLKEDIAEIVAQKEMHEQTLHDAAKSDLQNDPNADLYEVSQLAELKDSIELLKKRLNI